MRSPPRLRKLLPNAAAPNAAPETLAAVREALAKIGATISPRHFLSVAEHLDGRIRTDAEGRVEIIGSDGEPLVDWRATSEAKRLVGYTVEKYLNVVHGIEPDAPKAAEPPKPETPVPAAELKPTHLRVQEAYAAGPEAVQALMAELTGR